MRVAALDLGSNTTLLLIAEVVTTNNGGNKVDRVVLDETRVTKLGQGVHADRRFHPDALKRMKECLTAYSKEIKKHKCDKVVAVATSAARDVTNGNELLDMASALGIPVHIIDGPREARLTYSGALSDRDSTRGCAVVDVGGGSTEVIWSDNQGPVGRSVDVGSVRLTELFIKQQPIGREAIDAVKTYVRDRFTPVIKLTKPMHELVAVAGTPTTLACLDQAREFRDDLVNGYKLTADRIDQWIEKMALMTVEQRERLPGMQPKRADVIVTGSLILREAMRALGHNSITVSTRGVRYGVALAWNEF
jgi:exopolyphosphatase/guanosine-5'-triphosphate,3'-diphosphate pyrophosphatase